MADGYVFVEFNLEGQAREIDYFFFDQKVRGYVEWEDEEGLERLVNQLPENVIKDTHIFLSFSYSSHATYDAYNGEYDVETDYSLESFTILQHNYKEFTRSQLTLLLESIKDPDTSFERLWNFPDQTDDEERYIKSIHGSIAEWEEFYDEDFKPTVPVKKPVNADFLHLLQGGKTDGS